ncbi:hypothetical protein [Bifidobacterium mongoliense]
MAANMIPRNIPKAFSVVLALRVSAIPFTHSWTDVRFTSDNLTRAHVGST